jgi:sarcosine oxidase
MPKTTSRSKEIDVAVVGGGAMGTATAYQLARRKKDVHLFEQYAIGHELGSSHGYSRIIRRGYAEHPDYVPLVERAYELWRQIEQDSGESLLSITGIVEMGSPETNTVAGSKLASDLHKIPYEYLDAREIMRRHPQFTIPKHFMGVWQKDAGILGVERCLLAFRSQARKRGATLHEEEEVLSIDPVRGKDAGVIIKTRSANYRARKVVVSAGSWATRLLSDLALPLVVERQTLGFYRALKREMFELGTFPLFIMELPKKKYYYGFPYYGVDLMKVAEHHGGKTVTPETVDRRFSESDHRNLHNFLKKFIPQAAGTLQLGKVCMYTNTPDRDFILDVHPKHPSIAIAAGFSGHGFKFSSAVGEVMADLVEKGRTRLPINRFRISRFF